MPSCVTVNKSIDASNSSLEVQMARCLVQLVCEVGKFTHRNVLPACKSLLFYGTEGSEATSPSFATENKSIDALRSLLEVPIATHQMRGMRTEQFHNGQKIPIC